MTMKQRVRLLEKLAKINIATEKEIAEMTTEKMLQLPSITIEEMRELLVLQKAVKKNQFFSWLMQSDEDLSNV